MLYTLASNNGQIQDQEKGGTWHFKIYSFKDFFQIRGLGVQNREPIPIIPVHSIFLVFFFFEFMTSSTIFK
jgi:hypothetical protein